MASKTLGVLGLLLVLYVCYLYACVPTAGGGGGIQIPIGEGKKKRRKCLHGDSLVTLENGRQVTLKSLQHGMNIKGFHSKTSNLDKFLGFLHYYPNDNRTFIKLTSSSGKTALVTPEHAVLKVNLFGDLEKAAASSLEIGDLIPVSNNGSFKEEQIIGIDFEYGVGVFQPITASGNIVINDVMMTCSDWLTDANYQYANLFPMAFSQNL